MGDKKRFVYPSQTACFSYITILSSYQTIYFCYQQKSKKKKERKKETSTGGDPSFPSPEDSFIPDSPACSLFSVA